MRLATWNVNSLKARLGRVERWLTTFEPDVVCLQETKLGDDAFPALAFEALGYESLHHGEGRWNGVAILSRVGLDDPVAGLRRRRRARPGGPDRLGHVRWRAGGELLRAQRAVARPRPLPVQAAVARSARRRPRRIVCAPGDDIVVCGDFNIAPDDRDVYDPAKFEGATHTSAAERDRLDALVAWGLVDVFREHHDEAGLFSWWDYRGGDFHKKKGMADRSACWAVAVGRRVRAASPSSTATSARATRTTPRRDHAPVLDGNGLLTGPRS